MRADTRAVVSRITEILIWHYASGGRLPRLCLEWKLSQPPAPTPEAPWEQTMVLRCCRNVKDMLLQLPAVLGESQM